MTTSPLLLVLLGSLLGAAGQVLLKLGATGATRLSDFANVRIAAGFLIYGIGSILWVMALSKLPLSRVYPFTILTFLVVYVASIALLGEPVSAAVMLGAALIVTGLIVISVA